MPTPHRNSHGFAITASLVLVLKMVVIGLVVGVAAVRNAWFKRVAFETSVDVYVSDQDGVVLGKAVDFDEHETPLVPFVDYDVRGSGDNYRVLVGVRDDRFTSREKVYYTSSDCTLGGGAVACIFQPSTEVSGNATINSTDVDMLTGTGGVNYQVATQGSINYAIGSIDGDLPGRLYRQSETVCDTATAQSINSYWMSQAVVSQEGTGSGLGATNPPCYEVQFFVDILGDPIRCQLGTLVNQLGGGPHRCVGPLEGPISCRINLGADGVPNATTLPGVGDDACASDNGPFPDDSEWGGPGFGACPQTPEGDWGDPSGNQGFCCPPGVNVLNAGQCQQIVNNLPADGTFYEAESVGGTPNVGDALDDLFAANLPIDPNDFTPVAPDGEN